jgi:hypothetical protein
MMIMTSARLVNLGRVRGKMDDVLAKVVLCHTTDKL